MELDKWYKSIAEKRWPILPDTLKELKQVAARHSDLISFSDLANVCLSDAFLLFDLLRVVGASRSLQRNEAVPSVEQTLMLMGLESVINRFGKLTVLDATDGKLNPAVIEAVSDWMARGRVAAFIVKEWLSIDDDPKVEDCFIAALLYNLPACLYLIYRNQLPHRPLLQEVADTFDTDYSRLLERFVVDMPLPKGLLSLLGSGPVTKRKQLLKLAVATANTMEQGWWRTPWQVGIEAAAKLISAPYQEAYMGVVHAALYVGKHSHVPAYGFPVRSLLLMEGEYKPPQPAVSLQTATQLDTSIRESVRYLANDLKFERILYYQNDTSSKTLSLRYQVGLSERDALREQPVELAAGSFFHLLTRKPQSFHATKEARVQLEQKYPDAFFSVCGVNEFAIMTLFLGETLAGVFYVDNSRSGRSIDDRTYHRFKELVVRLTHTPH